MSDRVDHFKVNLIRVHEDHWSMDISTPFSERELQGTGTLDQLLTHLGTFTEERA